MNILFVGSVYPTYLLDYLLSSGLGADFAANNYQGALLDGFSENGYQVTIISSPPISKSNKCAKEILRKKDVPYEESGFYDFHYVGTSKIPFWKMPSELFRIRKSVKQRLSPIKKDNVICTYSLHSPFLLALLTLRRRISRVCVVIPDLPEYMSVSTGIRRLAKSIDRRLINLCLKRMDCFALLSKAMADRLPINNKPWVLVEGVYKPRVFPNVEKNKNKVILYTGQLQKRYGVFDLVEAFKLIHKDDYELWLCGGANPDEMKWLELQAEKDPRIKLMGRVPAEKVAEYQKRSKLLVNPRHSIEDFTKYSFPSKTMEYLASGTPTVMCKLPSIPEEYYEHLFFFEDESVEGMKNKIMDICEMEESLLTNKGDAASDFILTQKTPKCQVKKIIDIMFLK